MADEIRYLSYEGLDYFWNHKLKPEIEANEEVVAASLVDLDDRLKSHGHSYVPSAGYTATAGYADLLKISTANGTRWLNPAAVYGPNAALGQMYYTPSVFVNPTGEFKAKSVYIYGTNNSNGYISSDASTNMYFKISDVIPLVIDTTSAQNPCVRGGVSLAGAVDLGSSNNQYRYIHGIRIYENGTQLSSKYAPLTHTHSYVASAGYSASAARASYAATAGYSGSAGYAATAACSVTSARAFYSGSAGYSASAARASYAATAGYSGSAGYSASAARATYAATSAYSGSAGYAATAARSVTAARAVYSASAGTVANVKINLATNSVYYPMVFTNVISSNNAASLYIDGSTGTAQSSEGIRYNPSLNACYCSGGFYELSDESKKNFGDDIEVDLDKLSKLSKKYFTWKNDESNTRHIGISAQEVHELYPEIVNVIDEDRHLSVAYDKLSVVALKGIDVLNDKIKSLEKRLERFEKLIKE